MVTLRCPQCANVVEAQPGTVARCDRCGYTAPVPAGPAVPSPTPAAPAPRPGTREATYHGAAPAYPAAPRAPVLPTAYPVQPYAQAPGYPVAHPVGPYPFYPSVHGKPRSFWVSLLLGVVTLGVYFFVWNYKVPGELDREHNQPHATGWYWTSFAFQVVGALLIAAGVLATAAEQAARPGVKPATNVLVVVAYGVYFVATAFFLGYMFKEISKIERYRRERGLAEALAPIWFLLLYIFGSFLLVPQIVAYFLLQKSVNEVWQNVYAQKQVPWPL